MDLGGTASDRDEDDADGRAVRSGAGVRARSSPTRRAAKGSLWICGFNRLFGKLRSSARVPASQAQPQAQPPSRAPHPRAAVEDSSDSEHEAASAAAGPARRPGASVSDVAAREPSQPQRRVARRVDAAAALLAGARAATRSPASPTARLARRRARGQVGDCGRGRRAAQRAGG